MLRVMKSVSVLSSKTTSCVNTIEICEGVITIHQTRLSIVEQRMPIIPSNIFPSSVRGSRLDI
jgi:hypothetical protein